MSNFGAILTNAGAAKLSNAIALGVPLKLTQMAVGDGNGQPVTPDPAMTAIPGEKRRAAINTLFADPLAASQLVAEQIIPEDVGGWWIRCVGLYDDSNTLIAIANVPDTYKPLLTSGAGRTQIIRMVLIVSDTNSVELKIDAAVVLATRKYVDDVMKAHKESRDHPAATESLLGMMRFATDGEMKDPPPRVAVPANLLRSYAQPRRIIPAVGDVRENSYVRLCEVMLDPGVGNNIFSALISGGSNYGGTFCPNYLVTLSTRGYSGNQANLLNHVNVLFLGPGNHQQNVEFFVRNHGVNVELWMKLSAFPYPASMQILAESWVSILTKDPQLAKPEDCINVPIELTYTTLKKPTPTEIGLGYVQNAPMARSLEDGDENKYAPASLTYQLAHLLHLHSSGPNHQSASEIEKGFTRYATLQEVYAGAADDVTVTPKKLNALLNALGLTKYGAPMIGVPIDWPLAQMPQDIWPDCGMVFLSCAGQSFNKTTYPIAAQLYPSGVMIEIRAEFVRAWDNGRGVDPGRALLTVQSDQNRAHTHDVYVGYAAGAPTPSGGTYRVSGTNNDGQGPYPDRMVSSGGNESRPRNIAFHKIMRVA